MEDIKIQLKKSEQRFLREFVRTGTKKARAIAKANILLLANGGWETNTIAEMINVHRQRIWRVKKRFLAEGLAATLQEKPRTGQPKKYGDKAEATVIAEACTLPPKGRKRWTVRLLTERLQDKKSLRTVSRETVRLVLKKAKLSLG